MADLPDNPLQNDMRNAMRRLGATVHVITSHDGTRGYAMTATAVTSLSFDPPSVLICVNKETGLHRSLSQGSPFCVNILFADHEEIAANCAGRLEGENRFNEGDWQNGPENLPYLSDAQSSIFCKTQSQTEHTSHSIFIGTVTEIINREDVNPLMFLNGEYLS